MVTLQAVGVKFNRTDGGAWENGIGIVSNESGSTIDKIIDMNGKFVENDNLWDFKIKADMGCFIITRAM